MEVVPYPSVGLNEHARPRVELVDVSLDARKLAEEGALVDHICLRIDNRRLLSLGRHREGDGAGNRHCPKQET